MKKLKIVSLIIISLLVLVGCSKKQEELSKEESKEEQVEVVLENSPKNIAEGGKIAKFKDTYYYSEIKDNGKLYSKSTKKDSQPVKINDDIPGSINVYDEKLYYIDYSQKGKTQLVILDINDPTKREVIEEELMTMLIKDDKLIGAYRGEDGTGHMEGYSLIEIKVTDLKTNEVINRYDAGYGQVNIIDENRYTGFSTVIGNYINDITKENQMLFPEDNSETFMFSFVDVNEKGVFINVEPGTGHLLPQIYWVYNDDNYTTIGEANDSTNIKDDQRITNAVTVDEDLLLFTTESIKIWKHNEDKIYKIKDYKLDRTSQVYKFDNTIIILKEDGTWDQLDINELKKQVQYDSEENEEEEQEEVSTESKLSQMSDEQIKSYYKDFILNIYDKYYSERDYADTIEENGTSYAAVKSPYKTKKELIKSIQSYFTEEFLSDIRNRDDKLVVDGKEYLAISENEFAGIGEMETIKSKELKDNTLNVEFTANWAGELFDCRVEFVDINGIIKINKLEYDA